MPRCKGCRTPRSALDWWRIEVGERLTWLANWVRRILRQLMMAVAVEWRARVVDMEDFDVAVDDGRSRLTNSVR
jgi:hypothetical protein